MNKRGLGGIVAIFLIILLAIAAILIVWSSVHFFMERAGKQTNFNNFIINLELLENSIKVSEDGKVSFVVRRGYGEGKLYGIYSVLEDSKGYSYVETFRAPSPGKEIIEQFNSKYFITNKKFSETGLSDLIKLSIYPVFLENGREIIGQFPVVVNVPSTFMVCIGGTDNDRDGYGEGCLLGCDVDDNNKNVHFRVFYLDNDRDGYGNKLQKSYGCEAPINYVENGEDCDDDSGLINPGAIDSCNNIDDNCNGIIDDGQNICNSGETCLEGRCVILNVPPQENLICYEPFDLGDIEEGVSGRAKSFNSSEINLENLMNCGNAATRDSFTISFWVKKLSESQTKEAFYSETDWGSDSNCNNFFGDMEISIQGDSVYVHYRKGTACNLSLARYNIFTLGEWHHISLVKEMSQIRFYLNGSLYGQMSDEDCGIIQVDYSTIGGYRLNNYNGVNCNMGTYDLDKALRNAYIDQFRIYGRVLTNSEIVNLKNSRL